MTDKPFVHALEAHDFHLKYEPLETFPRDGREVFVQCSDGVMRRARWDARIRGIVVDKGMPPGVQMLRWQDA